MKTLDFVDQASLRDDIPAFNPGDTLNVHVKVIEGNKHRIQVFKGVVIRRQGGGIVAHGQLAGLGKDMGAGDALQGFQGGDQIGRHVYPAHRIDRGTSGVLLFALDKETARLAGETDEASLRDWQGELAIANPKTAPYGAAAVATLVHLKIDPKQYRVLTGTNISQTWQFVDTGNAKLGFVAWANLVEAGKTGEAWAVPASFYPPIEQQALVLKKGAAVDALVAWLKGPGQAQIKAAGYALPQ